MVMVVMAVSQSIPGTWGAMMVSGGGCSDDGGDGGDGGGVGNDGHGGHGGDCGDGGDGGVGCDGDVGNYGGIVGDGGDDWGALMVRGGARRCNDGKGVEQRKSILCTRVHDE